MVGRVPPQNLFQFFRCGMIMDDRVTPNVLPHGIVRRRFAVLAMICSMILLFWVCDALVDYFWLDEKPFWGLVITDLPRPAVYRRGVAIVCFAALGLLAWRSVTTRCWTERMMQQSEEKYRTFSESLEEGFFVLKDFVFVDCNEAACRLLACGREDIISHSPWHLSPPQQPDGRPSEEVARERIVAALAGTPQYFAWRHRRKDGGLIETEVSLTVLSIGDEKFVHGVLRDVTDRKWAEEALCKERDFVGTLVQASPAFLGVINADGTTRMMNEAMLQALGYTQEEVVGTDYLPTFVPAREHQVLAEVFKLIEEGKSTTNENHIMAKDGKEILVEWHGRPIFDQDGKLDFFFGFGTDITERRRAEVQLRESEERYRIVAEKTGQMVYDYDPATGAIDWRGAIEAITGYTAEEFAKVDVNGWGDLIHPDDRSETLRLLEEAKQACGRYDVEYRFCRKDGAYIHIDEHGVFLPSPDGRACRMLGTMNDVTESRRAEGQLKENAEELRWLFKSMINAFVLFESVFDENGVFVSYRFVYINDAYEKITGVKNEEVRGKTVHEVWPETEQSWVENYGEVVVAGIQKTFDMYHEPTQKLYHCNAYRPWDTTDRFCVIFEDITDRQRSEQAIRESELRYRELFERMSSGVAVYRAVDDGEDFVFVDFNRAAERINKATKADVLGERITQWFPGVEEYGLLDVLRQVWQTGRPQRHPVSFYKDDRVAGWRENFVYRLPSGEVVAIHDDVTKRKQAEEMLRRSRESLAQAQAFAHLGDFDWDVTRDTIEWSDEFYRLFGLGSQKFTPTVDAISDRVHPDDLEMLKKGFADGARSRKTYELEFRIVHEDGTVRWLHSINVPIFDEAGNLVRLVGAAQDVTDRKQAEEATRQAQEELIERQRREKELAQTELAKVREELVRQTRLATLGQLAGSIAHELRNPLGSIRNAAYFLKGEALSHNPKWAKHLGVIDEEINSADRIIRDLLEMTRGKAAQKQDVDLAKALAAAWQRVNLPDCVASRFCFDHEPYIVYADWAQLVQVLSNLILNAGQAMEGKGDILIAATSDSGYDEIVIRDTGPGIAAVHRQRVFEPLFSTKAKGTGLGLSICRQIIERHGGSLDLLEHEGPGAAFRIRLPQKESS